MFLLLRVITSFLSGEEVIIFASYPELPTELQGDEARPALTLLLGRRSQLKARKPRPDDPMPRGKFFFSVIYHFFFVYFYTHIFYHSSFEY